MFYKHWKKITLALTGFFWTSCDNNTTVVEAPLYGVPPQDSSSSESTESSSSFTPMPLYGVIEQFACYEDEKSTKMNGEITQTNLQCDDGVTCKETGILSSRDFSCSPIDDGDLNGAVVCPDYGVVIVTEKTYDCDGVTYNEAEFLTRYDRKYTTKPVSSSSTEQSSSSYNTCYPEGYFCIDRTEKYTESQAISNATDQAKWDGSRKIGEIILEQFKDKDVPKCLEDIQDSLESGFVALYGVMGCTTPSKFRCTDGTTYSTPEYLEQQEFNKEQEKKKPQYDKKYNEVYKEESEKLDKKIEDCLNSEKTEE